MITSAHIHSMSPKTCRYLSFSTSTFLISSVTRFVVQENCWKIDIKVEFMRFMAQIFYFEKWNVPEVCIIVGIYWQSIVILTLADRQIQQKTEMCSGFVWSVSQGPIIGHNLVTAPVVTMCHVISALFLYPDRNLHKIM